MANQERKYQSVLTTLMRTFMIAGNEENHILRTAEMNETKLNDARRYLNERGIKQKTPIGRCYIPRPHVEMSIDMERIQKALLHERLNRS